MAKDPAFLFYPNDWIGGTMGMTFEEKGAYVELLMYQFNRGHMTKHMITRMIGQLWVNLEVKFRMDSQGLYYNERLDKEKERRKKFTESRRNNVLGKNQHQKKVGHTTSHMENENIYNIEEVSKEELLIVSNSSICPEMFKIFKKYNPSYPHDKNKDFTACYQMAVKIADSKGWEKKDVLNGKKEDVLKSWEKIVNFVIADKWFSTRSLFDLNTEWQRLIQSMNGKFSGKHETKDPQTSIKKENEVDFDKYLKKNKSGV